jgi:rfaE bifunctional protein nucleotidyltransferase chain/domain
MSTRAKILPLAELEKRVAAHKQRGATIVLANGCFDGLHVGHIRYLQGAREAGDVLIVGVNSDGGVRRLKGEGRPILPQAARAELVAALAAVSYVVVFDEPDVENLLRRLKPQVHAKGTDYTAESVPERDVAAQLGVRIAIVGDAKDHSTRDLIAKIRGR